MNLVVKKFGGTSVGSAARIVAVAKYLADCTKAQEKMVIVLSAMSGDTDRLLKLAFELSDNPEPRELAALTASGEQISASLLAVALCQLGVPAKSFNALQLPIYTDNLYTKANISEIATQKIEHALTQNQLVIVTGFQGMTKEGAITTLGRGGSDTTAVALACALQAKECQIYTDVEGVYTADPRLVPLAYVLPSIPINVMLELASSGSKVLQWRSVALAAKFQMPVRVLSSFKAGCGTLINTQSTMMESPLISNLSHQMHLSCFVLRNKKPLANALASVGAQLAMQKIVIDHVSQKTSGEFFELAIYVNPEDEVLAKQVLNRMCQTHDIELRIEKGLARVSLTGIGLHAYPEVLAKFLSTLTEEHIVVHELINTETIICGIIDEKNLTHATRALHKVFFENSSRNYYE